MARETFTELEAWKTAVKQAGYTRRQVTRTKTNVYWQAYDTSGTIVGFFNTSHGGELTR